MGGSQSGTSAAIEAETAYEKKKKRTHFGCCSVCAQELTQENASTRQRLSTPRARKRCRVCIDKTNACHGCGNYFDFTTLKKKDFTSAGGGTVEFYVCEV
eukprot:752886_1